MQITLGPCKSWTLSLIQAPQDTSAQVQGRSQLSFSRRILLSSSLMSARAYLESPECIEGRFFLLFSCPQIKGYQPGAGLKGRRACPLER